MNEFYYTRQSLKGRYNSLPSVQLIVSKPMQYVRCTVAFNLKILYLLWGLLGLLIATGLEGNPSKCSNVLSSAVEARPAGSRGCMSGLVEG
jgi:hypothetical protein